MSKKVISVNTIIQRNSNILTSDLDGEKVMMSIKRGEYFGLGKVGSFIWDNIENPTSINELINNITQTYAIDKQTCFNEIKPFIADLLEKELISATY